jgi:hypothetical protein
VHFGKLRFSTMRYALVALRYVVTGILAPLLALLLVLLLVELVAAIDAALRHGQENAPASGNFGGSVRGAGSQAKAVFMEGGS